MAGRNVFAVTPEHLKYLKFKAWARFMRTRYNDEFARLDAKLDTKLDDSAKGSAKKVSK
jgi:hypothetical protein